MSKKSGNIPIKQKRMILEKNAKTGTSVFKKLSVDGICLLFLMTLKEL
jgi:hypothetical protein